MIHMYRFFLWYARMTLAIAETSGNRAWIELARLEVSDMQGEMDRMEVSHACR